MNFLKTCFTVILLFVVTLISAQNFEGVIEFTRTNYYQSTNYRYYVAAKKVRIDELDKEGNVTGTMLVDLTTKKVFGINHKRQLYMEIKSHPSVKDLSKSKVTKTTEKKTILGYNCTKWTVSNDDYKTKATYWVINKANYFFFKQLLTALNRKDKIALYFINIPNNIGYFPINSEEKGFDGKLKAKLSTTKITKKRIDSKMFDIPAGYQKFDN